MLPIVLVLLVASSVFAAPSQIINQYETGIGDGTLIGNAANIVDGGDYTVYTLNVLESIKDIGYSGDRTLANAILISILGTLAPGKPGDACAPANLIDAYAFGKNLNSAIATFRQSYRQGIDLIVQLVNDPESARYSVSSSYGCPGEGRSYNFEQAWKRVLNKNKSLDELYCVNKRLYNSLELRNNIVAAYSTAAALPPIRSLFEQAASPLNSFVAALASGNPQSVTQRAIALKRAL